MTNRYEEAVATLKGRPSKKVGNNTHLIDAKDGTIALRYHYTFIVTFDEDGVVLDNGGWSTSTTKERIHKYLPDGWGLFQEKFVWYLFQYADRDGTKVPYENGTRITHDGVLLAPCPNCGDTRSAAHCSGCGFIGNE